MERILFFHDLIFLALLKMRNAIIRLESVLNHSNCFLLKKSKLIFVFPFEKK